MTIVYRKNLNRPMSWEELDGNFEEVERIGVQSQQYANNASTSAAASASSASLAQQQVVVASGEADRAKSEADRASEITGVTTISEAFTPFPDVWIPFSDNLRMLAGHGDEIKVGDYTVASQATFSRATTATYIDKDGVLKTAAINEPRFEKDGIPVEPQSTNIVQSSSLFQAISVSGVSYSDSSFGDLATRIFTNSIAASAVNYNPNPTQNNNPQSGVTYTGSCIVNLKSGSGVTLRLRFTKSDGTFLGGATFILDTMTQGASDSTLGVVTSKSRHIGGGYYVVSITCTPQQSGTVAHWNVIAAANSSSIVEFGAAQIEALPFATSHIPTNGAAATRADDIVTIPKSLNNCAEFYSGPDAAIVTVGADKLTINPPNGKLNVRNFRGFFTPLTAAQKAALK